MEIQQTYRMLKYQEALYKKELDIKKKETVWFNMYRIIRYLIWKRQVSVQIWMIL